MLRNDTLFRTVLIVNLILVGAATSAVAQVDGPLYRMIELPAAETGGSTKAYALNNTGQIVGWMESGADRHGAHWHVEATTDLHGTVHFDLQHPYLRFTVGYSEAYDISNADQIVGTARAEVDCPPTVVVTEAFILRAGVLTDLATPYSGDALTNLGTFSSPCAKDAWDSAATGISNRNHVVGWADIEGLVMHAFLVVPSGGDFYRDVMPDPNNPDFVNDLIIDLGTMRGDADPVSAATAVNDWGQITGYSYTLASPTGADDPLPKAAYRAFIVTPNDTDADGFGDDWFDAAADGGNTLMQDIGTLGGYNSWGRDINNDGDIVGESDTDPDVTGGHNTRAFLWSSGAMTDLGTLGGDFSAASGVNARGEQGSVDIVGWASNPDNQRRAFVYRDGEMYDLNDHICTQTEEGVTVVPNIVLTEARDINDDGWIVGWGEVRGSDGQDTRGFLLIPMDPNDCIFEEDAAVDDGADDGSSSGDTGDTGGDGDPASGDPIIGTPGNLADGSSADPNGTSGSVPAPTLCGVGTFAFAPLTLLGLSWMKLADRRIRRRK